MLGRYGPTIGRKEVEEKGEREVVEKGGSIVVATSPDTLNGYEMVRRAGRVGSKVGLGTSDTE